MKSKVPLYNTRQKDSNNFVRWLNRLLRDREISPSALAESCDISYRTINRWLNEAHMPDNESLKKLTNSKYINMELKDLLRMAHGDSAPFERIVSAEEAMEHISKLPLSEQEEIAHRILGKLPSPNVAGFISRAAYILSERDYRYRP